MEIIWDEVRERLVKVQDLEEGEVSIKYLRPIKLDKYNNE